MSTAPVRVNCPKCQTILQMAVVPAGAIIKCPKCATAFRLGESAPPESPTTALPAPSASAGMEQPSPPPAPLSSSREVVVALGVTLGLFVLCGGGGWLVYSQMKKEAEHARQHKDDEDEDGPEDEPLDPAEESRLAAEREAALKEHRSREGPVLERLRQDAENRTTGELLAYPMDGRGFRTLAWSADGQTLASLEQSGAILWGLSAWLRPALDGHDTPVSALAFSPDGRTLATGGDDGSLRIWDVKTRGLNRTIEGVKGRVESLVWSPGGKQLAAGLLIQGEPPRGEVWIADASGDEKPRKLAGLPAPATRLAWTPDGRTILVGSDSPAILLFDPGLEKPKRRITTELSDRPFALSPDGKTVAVLGEVVALHAVASGKELLRCDGDTTSLSAVAFSPDGKLIVAGGCKATDPYSALVFWDAKTGKRLRKFPTVQIGRVDQLLFSPGGQVLASAGPLSKFIKVWDVDALLDSSKKPSAQKATAAVTNAIAAFATIGEASDGYHVYTREEATNDDLAILKKLPRLGGVHLNGSPNIGDAGLAHLKGTSTLLYLTLSGTKVTAEGLAGLEGMSRLHSLNLAGLKVEDAGTARLAGLKDLRELNLSGTQVTDAGLAHLKGLTRLEDLDVSGNGKVTDAGLAHLAGLTALHRLSLLGVKATDAGLANLKGMTEMVELHLEGEGITDAGFVHLAGMSKLSNLRLASTPRLTGAFLQHLKGKDDLVLLDLRETGTTDEGLRHIADLRQVRILTLPERIGDAGLEHLKGLTDLRELYLIKTKVAGPGLAHLAGLKSLTGLDLAETKVDSDGVAHLKGLTRLVRLDLNRTKVSDAGLVHLRGLKKLRKLYLTGAPVSDRGIAELKTALPELDISE